MTLRTRATIVIDVRICQTKMYHIATQSTIQVKHARAAYLTEVNISEVRNDGRARLF